MILASLYLVCGVALCLYFRAQYGPAPSGILTYLMCVLGWPFWVVLYVFFLVFGLL